MSSESPPTLSSRMAWIVCAAVCLVLFYWAFQNRAYLSNEFDEGVYWSTFKSVQNGFPLYQQTYMSQPPGFFVLTFPLYVLFGSTLEAARLAVFVYSLVGLFALVWLGWELRSPVFALIAIVILYRLPVYTVQIMTFHGDSVPPAFSALALASALRFRNTGQTRWVALSACCLATAVMVKSDVTVLPSLLLVLLVATLVDRRQFGALVKSLGVFAAAFAAAAAAFVLPFGVEAVYSNVVELRLRTAAGIPVDPNTFIRFFQAEDQLEDYLLWAMILGGLAFVTIRDARFPLILFALWIASTVALLMVYRPLLPHHLAFLPLPIAASFSFPLYKLLSLSKRPRLVTAAAAMLIGLLVLDRLQFAVLPTSGVATPLQQRGVELVQTYTEPDDFIVADDGLVIALSGRRTPPELTDLSFVRIASGGVTAEQLEHNLITYQPKLVMVWTDRLRIVPGFVELMERYHYRLIEDPDTQHQAYVLES